MKRLTAAIFLMLSVCAAALAQTDAKSLINGIKKNPAYVYGEATLATEEEAADAAKELLSYNIRSFIREQGDALQLLDVAVPDVVAGCEFIRTTRGSMARVLAYVKKETFCVYEEVKVPEPEPAAVQEETPAQTPDVKYDFEARLNEVSDLFVLYSVLDSKEWSSHCTYGKVKQDTDKEMLQNSYLVIFKPDTYMITGVLSPKKDTRINLATGSIDSTRNYPNCQALWVKFEY